MKLLYAQHMMPFSRWLLLNGKHDEVEKIYRKMARMNSLPVTNEAINAFKELNVVKDETVRYLPFFFLANI